MSSTSLGKTDSKSLSVVGMAESRPRGVADRRILKDDMSSIQRSGMEQAKSCFTEELIILGERDPPI